MDMIIVPSKRKLLSESQRMVVITKTNGICRICKRTLPPHFFQVHHKDGNKANNSEDNLEALCMPCHKEISDIQLKTIMKGNQNGRKKIGWRKHTAINSMLMQTRLS